MSRRHYKLKILICTFFSVVLLLGCGDLVSKPEDIYVIRVGESIVTLFDFNRAFENDNARIIIGPQPHDGVIQTRCHFGAHGVHDPGAVEGYRGDIVFFFEQKMI